MFEQAFVWKRHLEIARRLELEEKGDLKDSSVRVVELDTWKQKLP